MNGPPTPIQSKHWSLQTQISLQGLLQGCGANAKHHGNLFSRRLVCLTSVLESQPPNPKSLNVVLPPFGKNCAGSAVVLRHAFLERKSEGHSIANIFEERLNTQTQSCRLTRSQRPANVISMVNWKEAFCVHVVL